MQCLGLGNRAEASLFYVAKGNLHKSYRRELQHRLLKQFIIHSALQLFFDWPKAYSEFSKSAPVTSKLTDYTIVMSRSRVIMSCMQCMISKGNYHVKFVRFVLFAVREEAKI